MHKTEVKSKTLNPVWNQNKESFTVHYTHALKFIDVECWDHDKCEIFRIMPIWTSFARSFTEVL